MKTHARTLIQTETPLHYRPHTIIITILTIYPDYEYNIIGFIISEHTPKLSIVSFYCV